jgi:hypothetical protein
MIFRINTLPLTRLSGRYICCFGRCDRGYSISFGRSDSFPWNDIIFEGYP